MLFLRKYLERPKFTDATDHDTLKRSPKLASAMGNLTRWRPLLMEYDFDIFHTTGIKDQAADTISWRNTKGMDDSGIEDDIQIMAVTTHAQSRQKQTVYTTPDKNQSGATESNLAKLEEFPSTYSTEDYSGNNNLTVGIPRSTFKSCRKEPIFTLPPMNGAVQEVVLLLMHPSIFYCSYYSTLAAYGEERQMYDMFRRKYVWCNRSSYVYSTNWHFQECPGWERKSITNLSYCRSQQAVHPTGFQLKSLAIFREPGQAKNLWSLILMNAVSWLDKFQHQLYRRRTWPISFSIVAHSPLKLQKVCYLKRANILSVKFLFHCAPLLGLKIATITYHWQIYGQVESYDRTLVMQPDCRWTTTIEIETYISSC